MSTGGLFAWGGRAVAQRDAVVAALPLSVPASAVPAVPAVRAVRRRFLLRTRRRRRRGEWEHKALQGLRRGRLDAAGAEPYRHGARGLCSPARSLLVRAARRSKPAPVHAAWHLRARERARRAYIT
jgi:hypothetical protein